MGCGCWDLELFFYLDLCFPTASHEVSPGDPHQPSFTPTALPLGVLFPVIPRGGCAGIAAGIVGLGGGRANRVQKGLGIGAPGCSALLWLPNYDT